MPERLNMGTQLFILNPIFITGGLPPFRKRLMCRLLNIFSLAVLPLQLRFRVTIQLLRLSNLTR